MIKLVTNKISIHANRFNEWLAVRGTLAFGSMWMFYLFFLYGFGPIFFPKAQDSLLYWSNTIQLWALPLLMVGQHVQGRALERRDRETHDLVMKEFKIIKKLCSDCLKKDECHGK